MNEPSLLPHSMWFLNGRAYCMHQLQKPGSGNLNSKNKLR
uniref:Uncharacterized protein n=1 Tax=Physcomitrium patens TaxID=3218 RepID=A0A2K1IDN0_PHYPA|nr:hypothetical protein PHYPA_029537 [Physcomitrium patens]